VVVVGCGVWDVSRAGGRGRYSVMMVYGLENNTTFAKNQKIKKKFKS